MSKIDITNYNDSELCLLVDNTEYLYNMKSNRIELEDELYRIYNFNLNQWFELITMLNEEDED